MSNLLGVHWSVMHRKPEHYDFLKRLQPTVLKILDGGLPDYTWVRQNIPGALVIARDWALSEQHEDMLRDPVGTGVRHAQEWFAKIPALGFDPANTLILGINEPRVWEHGVSEALRKYTIAMCDEAHGLGLRVGAMQLSVGWPANTGHDTPPDWSPWHGVEDAIKRGNHALVLHEYWADLGVGENWGWWAGRALKCPWRVPIVIGECGIDMYVKDGGVAHESRGWVGRMSPTRYAAELHDYNTRMATDSRFVGSTVFALDYANREWASFDIEIAADAILSLPPVTPAEKPADVYLPIIEGGTVSHEDLFPRVMKFISKWEGGYVDNPLDRGGATNLGITIGTLTRWRETKGLPAPTVEDVRNLTREEADAIYRAWYWEPSGASKATDYSTALLLMDSAVLHGVGAPVAWVKEYGFDAWKIAARRLRVYAKDTDAQWATFGRGWVNRVADLLSEIGAN